MENDWKILGSETNSKLFQLPPFSNPYHPSSPLKRTTCVGEQPALKYLFPGLLSLLHSTKSVSQKYEWGMEKYSALLFAASHGNF